MYGLELIIIIFATVAQALTSGSVSMNVYVDMRSCLSYLSLTCLWDRIGLIIFWRVLMGIGIGGDYPLSSIIVSSFWI